MKVLFFPYEPDNPYQPNLLKALEEEGFVGQGVKDTTFESLIDSANGQDILHLHWAHPYLLTNKLSSSIYRSMIFFKIILSQKFKGRKLIWTIHNLTEHEPRHPVFEKLCYRILARLADGLIVHSQYAREKVAKVYWLGQMNNKVHVIPHGNYLRNYPNDISKEQAREKLSIGVEKKVFLFLGQIRSYKGVPELISSFKGIATGNEVLMIVGKPLNEKIKSELGHLVFAQKDIKFIPGFVDGNDIQLYMNAADAVVFPFRDIFTSGSALLAMSFSKAMILPDLESLKEITAFGGTIPYHVENEEGLRKALLKAISADLKILGIRNLKAAKKFSWSSIGKQTADLYIKALPSKHMNISVPGYDKHDH